MNNFLKLSINLIIEKYQYILKLLKMFYYNINYQSRLYKKSKKLDILLVYLENVNISSINTSNYYCEIIFKDNSILIFWNANRWYAWMNQGNMTFSNGKTLMWCSEMPSYETLYKYKKLIKKFEKYKNIEDSEKIDNINDYLPESIIRKVKLKKLKKL